MGTHSTRAFLNSCLKVPIDPCNNCPAPIYNRPKMYLGRSTGTPASTAAKITTATSVKASDIDTETMWASSGIRSLAKFYDSIPDYCDINHLTEEEFYSTLDSLKTTSRQLRTKSCAPEVSSNTSSSLSSQCQLRNEKTKKSSSSKSKAGAAKSGKKKKPAQKRCSEQRAELRSVTETPFSGVYTCKSIIEKPRNLKIYTEEFKEEVASFKRLLKDCEAEFRRPVSSSVSRSKSTSFTKHGDDEAKILARKEKYEKLFTKPAPSSCGYNLRDRNLKKSLSFNDIRVPRNPEPKDYSVKIEKDKQFQGLPKAEHLIFKDPAKRSNFFAEKFNESDKNSTPINGEDFPKITLETPNSSKMSNSTSSRSSTGRSNKRRVQKEPIKVPFSIFDLNGNKKENIEHPTPSPVHPVARPNLAATLRAEVSKKKLKELQNNCTYHDKTPQFDWGVRKTPAWKTLALNESHKNILLERLATRKAEQAMQQRQYEQSMQLMRRRVKSAPLLLEGTTFWGPNVGKLTHTCQSEGITHTCDTSQRKQRKKGSRSCEMHKICSESSAGSRMSHRMSALRKIYGNSAKSASRNSTKSTKQLPTKEQTQLPNNNDSGDELSSMDRAYL